MVGIVGILLLGSLAWSAVGAMFSALGAATSALSNSRPTPITLPIVAATAVSTPPAGPVGAATPVPGAQEPTGRRDATPIPGVAPTVAARAATAVLAATTTPAGTPSPGATAALAGTLAAAGTPAVAATAVATTLTPTASGRAPWILLPQPAPGARVAPGPLVVEARGRGDAPITALRLELDGAGVGASFEQRSESTWRAAASTQITPGRHNVRATVVDDQGRTGSFRWTFDAGP